MNNKTTQQVTKEAQTKVSETMGVFYDAQLALQKNAFDTMRATLEGTIALQRSAIRAMTRAMDVQTVPVVTPEQVSAQFRAIVAPLPGMTPETADKMAKDVAQTFVTMRDSSGKQVEAVRQAATQAATQYEQFLAQVEGQSVQGFQAAAQSAESAAKVTRQVSGEWVDAMFDAVTAAVKAAEDAQAQVKAATEKVVKGA